MADEPRDTRDGGPLSTQPLRDPGKHQQTDVFERDNRPQRSAPGDGGAEGRFECGEDTPAGGEPPVGKSIGPDTAGVVAPPAAGKRPGVSTLLGGTPGANATRSGGRDTDY